MIGSKVKYKSASEINKDSLVRFSHKKLEFVEKEPKQPFEEGLCCSALHNVVKGLFLPSTRI